MAKVNRRVMWGKSRADDFHETIECAVMSDGSSPATEFLVSLSRGYWREDPEHKPPRDPDQINDFVRLMGTIEHIGKEGCPETGGSVNHLEDGIWEFKRGKLRLTYWDTPGDGTYSPKAKIDDKRTIVGPDPCDFWWYPRMDPILRLGCAWPKEGQFAPSEGIENAKSIREEDCAHDRRSTESTELERPPSGDL